MSSITTHNTATSGSNHSHCAMQGNLIGILGGVILSSDSLFIRLMAIENSWLIVVLRGLCMWGCVTLLWLLVPRLRGTLGVPWLTRHNLLPSCFFCLASACFVNALNQGNVATVLVIISSTPFVSAIISWLLYRAKIERSLLIATLAGIIGVAIVMSGKVEGNHTQANYYALGTAVSMALSFIFSARVEHGTLGLPSLGAVLASLLIVAFLGHGMLAQAAQLHLWQWGWVLVEGALVMPVAMGLIALSSRFVSPVNSGLFLLLETALAPLWIYLFLAQVPTYQTVLGGAVIIISVISQILYTKRVPQAE